MMLCMKHHNLVYLAQAAECLKVLAHPKRLEIITILRDHESLSVGEIAQVMKIPVGTVKSRLFKARKLIEKELEDTQHEK